ncbi:hypothetical protein [Legionella waltersii]|uniref:Uncharacterized protein n=1 Tax=Legionella waltersii TaxID=66969 RepID=A0A0W1A1S4_9GAMM|nr:hypothetical protein [Legionella waltersii]KTD75268.1 hypothetical protein Lwal_3309 [Legionella waltersii]SNV06813.1 Uncharacterised protein [Legionella waltersii]
MGKFLRSLHKKTEIIDKVDYHRELYQSFMTGPEWRNVEMAEEYAQFLDDGHSMFQFPYFRQIFGLWRVVYESYSAARKYNSIWQIVSSEYMLMDLFIGVFTTLELLPKGILSILLSPFLNKDNDTEMQKHLADFYSQYAKDLHTLPFYDHNYSEARAQLARAYEECEHKTWGDWFSWTFISLDLWARKWISKPLSYWFHQDNNLVPATTDILVKERVDNSQDLEALKSSCIEHLESIEGVHVVDKNVYFKPTPSTEYAVSAYARLRVPRYDSFQTVLNSLNDEGIQLRKIAGQDRVQVKCEINASNDIDLEDTQEKLNDIVAQKPLYSYGDSIHPYRRLCMFDIHVRELADKVEKLNESKYAKVKFIHNF